MKSQEYIIALDQGTTSTRAIVFNRKKEMVALAQREIRQIYPQPGYVEQDPQELYETALEVMEEVVNTAGISLEAIAGIGITNQRETTVVFDRMGQPVYNAIVWQCRRTADRCEQLKKDGHEEYVRYTTGLPIDPYFSATKAAWILDEVPGARKKAEEGALLFGTVDTWLLYKLTQGKSFFTDHTNASRTMLYNIRRLEWDDTLCQVMNVPKSMLPEVKESSGIFGVTEVLGKPIPIGALVGDQQAALFGQGCFAQGEAKNTYGTGCFLLVNTGTTLVKSQAGLLSTIGISQGGKLSYALEGSVFIGGALMKWLRDELGLFKQNGEIEALARAAESTGGVYIVPAFTGLGAPWWEPKARGAIFGLTRGTGPAELVRAGLEAIAFQVFDLLQVIQDEYEFPLSRLKVDGGASVNGWLLEFQSALLELPVERPVNIETTALGAFYLAGLALGFWETREEIFASEEGFMVVEARMAEDDRRTLLKGWKNSVQAVREWSKN